MTTFDAKAFEQLKTTERLVAFDQAFLKDCQAIDSDLADLCQAYRQDQADLDPSSESAFLMRLAVRMEAFLAAFFDIEQELVALSAQWLSHDPLLAFKSHFIKKEAKRRMRELDSLPAFETLDAWLTSQLPEQDDLDEELAIAQLGMQWLQDPGQHQANLDQLIAWCAHGLYNPKARVRVQHWVAFRLPQRLDPQALVPVEANDGVLQIPDALRRHRSGFALTDEGMSQRAIQDQVHYCVYCHEHEQGDFCSRGFPVKKSEPERGLKTNAQGLVLTGCPLEERISEMHVLRRDGHPIAALAMIMRDNPLCPATGHRICNDCMKACIYQKQEPVDIPQIESSVLKEVLRLPWGVEIYDLLTRWNPLRPQQWLPKPDSGLSVLIMGMGPAGMTLAHHLLMQGHRVVGMDGLVIEALPQAWLQGPIRDYATLEQSLDERTVMGFGGVAEYGITVRWDKNNLTLLYLMLARRPNFRVFGSTRFGGSITLDRAWHMGFDHVALAVGAGLPKALSVPGSMAPGMRQANDFLMALQLSEAFKATRLSLLHVRMPAVVIGGGLTGVDAATELQAYYLQQIQLLQHRYEALKAVMGEAALRARFRDHDLMVLDEQLEHARTYHAQVARGALHALLHAWGGVTLLYRRSIQASPAYRLNHEELTKALEEGVLYRENLEPISVEVDAHGWVRAVVCQSLVWEGGVSTVVGDPVEVPARTLLAATGAQPNVAYAFEHRGELERRGFAYACYSDVDGELQPVDLKAHHCKSQPLAPFVGHADPTQRVSVLGDTHAQFHGSVVKAMASAKILYPHIDTVMRRCDPQASTTFLDDVAHHMQTTLIDVNVLSPQLRMLTVHAPALAAAHQPGHLYRLARRATDDAGRLQTAVRGDAVALLAERHPDDEHALCLWLDGQASLAEQLLLDLQPGDPIALMGPTGVRVKCVLEVPSVVLAVDASAWRYARVLAVAFHAHGARVSLYVDGGDQALSWLDDPRLQAACDRAVVYGDASFEGRSSGSVYEGVCEHLAQAAVGALHWYGSSAWLQREHSAWQQWRQSHGVDVPTHLGVQGPMQCMMKGVCAQCLQWQVDPQTGQRTKAVYACSWPSQPADLVDKDHLSQRQQLHGPQATLYGLYQDHILEG